jgi:hypothetical protein
VNGPEAVNPLILYDDHRDVKVLVPGDGITKMNIFPYILIGFFAGMVSGLIGIGGGIIIVPALIFLFGFSQHAAQGTTLAMLIPPIGILAALAYYRQGHINLPVAGLLCLGFVIGGFLGAKFAVSVPEHLLKKIFGVCLMVIAGYMILK